VASIARVATSADSNTATLGASPSHESQVRDQK